MLMWIIFIFVNFIQWRHESHVTVSAWKYMYGKNRSILFIYFNFNLYNQHLNECWLISTSTRKHILETSLWCTQKKNKQRYQIFKYQLMLELIMLLDNYVNASTKMIVDYQSEIKIIVNIIWFDFLVSIKLLLHDTMMRLILTFDYHVNAYYHLLNH